MAKTQSSKLKKKLWRGSVALLFFAILFSILKSTIFPSIKALYYLILESILLVTGVENVFVVITALVLVPLTFLGLVYALGLFSEKAHLTKPTLLKLFSKRVPLLEIIRKIQETPENFQEVMFELTPGVWKKGVLIEEKRYPKIGGLLLYSIWEPRPASPGGEIHYVEETKIFKTGRHAGETIQEVTLGWGHSPEESN